MHIWSTNIWRGDQEYSWILSGEMVALLINGVGETGYPQAKELNWTPIIHHLQRLTWND